MNRGVPGVRFWSLKEAHKIYSQEQEVANDKAIYTKPFPVNKTQVISMELCHRSGIPSEPSLKERSDAQRCVNRGVPGVRF